MEELLSIEVELVAKLNEIAELGRSEDRVEAYLSLNDRFQRGYARLSWAQVEEWESLEHPPLHPSLKWVAFS